jgi:hypothetical protein
MNGGEGLRICAVAHSKEHTYYIKTALHESVALLYMKSDAIGNFS